MCWWALVRRMQQTSPFQGSANATLQKQFFSSSVSPKIVYSKVPKGVDLDYFSCSPVDRVISVPKKSVAYLSYYG